MVYNHDRQDNVVVVHFVSTHLSCYSWLRSSHSHDEGTRTEHDEDCRSTAIFVQLCGWSRSPATYTSRRGAAYAAQHLHGRECNYYCSARRHSHSDYNSDDSGTKSSTLAPVVYGQHHLIRSAATRIHLHVDSPASMGVLYQVLARTATIPPVEMDYVWWMCGAE